MASRKMFRTPKAPKCRTFPDAGLTSLALVFDDVLLAKKWLEALRRSEPRTTRWKDSGLAILGSVTVKIFCPLTLLTL